MHMLIRQKWQMMVRVDRVCQMNRHDNFSVCVYVIINGETIQNTRIYNFRSRFNFLRFNRTKFASICTYRHFLSVHFERRFEP